MKSPFDLPEYRYRSKDLLKVLVDVGFSKNETSAYQKLFRLKYSGRFTPPVALKGEKNEWVFTERQLIDIAKNLSPGGRGEWHFNN